MLNNQSIYKLKELVNRDFFPSFSSSSCDEEEKRVKGYGSQVLKDRETWIV